MHRYFLFLIVIGFLSAGAAYPQAEQSGYILTRLGHDTIAVEKYSLDAGALKGTSVARSPRTTIREYTARFNESGSLENFHITYQPFGGTTLTDREYTYSDDSIRVTIKQDTAVTRFAVAAAERPFPLFIDVFGPWQVALERAVGAGKKQFSLVQGRRVLHYDIDGTPPGKIRIAEVNNGFGPFRAEVGSGGRLEKFDMTETNDKFIVERISETDVMALAKEFAARDKAGSAMGALSPRDSIQTEVNGAHLRIDYSRPAVRGRTIFGQVVPWDSVWRTGANAATQLTSDKELQFGSTVVPAGSYSLFSVPSPKGWLLIINQQHGQWGTEYNQSKDLARLPLEVKQLADLVERFTFEISPEGTKGTLRFKWDHTEASIPFTVR